MAADKEQLVPGDTGSNLKRSYAGRSVLRLGVTQIVLGLLVIAAQIVVLAVYNIFFNSISQGIWCGVAFIVCGVIGIVAGKRRTSRWITAHLVLCIFACIFAFAIIALSALTSVYNYGSPYTYMSDPCPVPMDYIPSHHHHDPNDMAPVPQVPGDGMAPPVDDYWNSYYYGYGPRGERYPCYSNGHYVINVPWVVQFSMNLFMGVAGIINAILSVVAATLSCYPLCCDPFKQQKKDDRQKKLLAVTSQEQEQEAEPLPVKVVPSDFIVMATEGSSHI